jgi:hypothetical protein
MKFTYGSGQRVLDGYTLKRGIGRGGFGEVYYAVSDGGKEVALKLVRGHNMEVELRGMAQCLNLKHPNLLDLYDLRTDEQGDHWVIMEYIGGEPLSVVLTRHPKGLPPDLARQWLTAIARAVGCLHDHGIVHRDLKPGNIFIEEGIVKVGDYGLSKFMSSSQHIAQTQSVGTVHYMAPEISSGNYNKQIDIYAAGVILYEMLTGRVPFDGESTGEILMKHLTSPPDLSKLPVEYVPAVGKALAKNPAQRYASMGEMVKALEETERGYRQPVRHAAARPAPPPVPPRYARRVVVPPLPPRPEPILNALPVIPLRGQVAELTGSMALTPLFAGVAAALAAAVLRVGDLTGLGLLFFLTVALSWAVLVPAKVWTGRRGNSVRRRVVMMMLGMLVGLGALWVQGWTPGFPLRAAPHPAKAGLASSMLPGVGDLPEVAGHLCYFGLAFFALRWWKMADRRRPHRFSFVPVFAAAFWGLILLPIWPDLWPGALALVLTAAIVQLVSPWDQPPPRACRPVRLRYA